MLGQLPMKEHSVDRQSLAAAAVQQQALSLGRKPCAQAENVEMMEVVKARQHAAGADRKPPGAAEEDSCPWPRALDTLDRHLVVDIQDSRLALLAVAEHHNAEAELHVTEAAKPQRVKAQPNSEVHWLLEAAKVGCRQQQ